MSYIKRNLLSISYSTLYENNNLEWTSLYDWVNENFFTQVSIS